MIILGVLAGCAGSPVRIAMMDDEDLSRVEAIDLCFAYARFDDSDSKIKAELLRRDVFSEQEWRAVDTHKIFIGMSELAFRCSWPFSPAMDLDSLRLEQKGTWGVRTLYKYNRNTGAYKYDEDLLPGPWPKKVYFENGVLIAYQESSAAHDPGCFAFKEETCFDFDGVVSTEESDAFLR